jgi:hypothetical protein
MDINVSIVDQQVRGLAQRLKPQLESALDERLDETKARSVAFVVLCTKALLELSDEEAIAALTEGGNDFGVDAIQVSDVVDGEFTVTLFQAKYHHENLDGVRAFPELGVSKAVQAVRGLFDPEAVIEMNHRLRARIEEIRSLIGEANIPRVRFLLCSNGQRWSAESQGIIDREHFPSDRVSFEHIDHETLIRILQSSQPAKDTLQFVGRSIVEDMNYARVFIGKIPVTELARLMETHGDRLLQRNIRRYLGLQGNRVNRGIEQTLRDDTERTNFFFYNNGVTLICERFDYNALQPENHRVKVEGLQIINGGQTSKTVQATLSSLPTPPSDIEQTFVLVRLYQIPKETAPWVQTVTYATNSQSPVDLRDLHANDERQKGLELSMKELGYEYRRQRSENAFKPNEIGTATAAEAVVSVWRRRPQLARFQTIEHFGKHYDSIFTPDLSAPQLIIAVLLFRIAENKRKKAPADAPDFLPYASHFAAMLMGEYLLVDLGKPLTRLDHRIFFEARGLVEQKGEAYFQRALEVLEDAVQDIATPPVRASLRRLSAIFRRSDLFDYLPRPSAATGLPDGTTGFAD